MGGEGLGEADVLPSMWPDDLNTGKQFNIEKPGVNRDIQEDVNINDPSIIDFQRLLELTNYSEKGSSQLAYLVKHWEYKQANAVRLLNEEIGILSKQREEVELKRLQILEAQTFEEEKNVGDKRSISVVDENEISDIWGRIPRRKIDILAFDQRLQIDAEYDTFKYWRQRAQELETLLEASMQREHILMQKLQETIKNLENQSSPVEELSHILKRADNFLHFVLQNAPVVFGHQDKDLRYRFIYNHFPTFAEEDIIGKTDMEIFSGIGVDEIHNFKKEVLERGKRAMREMTFKTEFFGSKTFMIYVEPVFNKAGETIGVNYMGVDVTAQVEQRENMAKIREELAVQKAKETELNKSIHITEETMRAKQMLATMSHEIRSPLTGVVSMAEILANTKLDKEQRQLLDVMLSSGDLVLQLINDILDLSKVESGAMKLEATKFRPREVVRHVLQTAAASLQKDLVLEGNVSDGVPVEIVGDVLRIRQILTNLISNAIKFTHKGRVGINLHLVSQNHPGCSLEENNNHIATSRPPPLSRSAGDKSLNSQSSTEKLSNCVICEDLNLKASHTDEASENQHPILEENVWLQCDVYDTGIGIPEKALPSLFKKYMQASADHARKYGGTGLGLAICKQLVELMGGQLTVISKEHHGSTFTFVLPYKIPPKPNQSDDPDDVSAISGHLMSLESTDETSGSFYFKPSKLGASSRSKLRKPKLFGSRAFDSVNTVDGQAEEISLDCIETETGSVANSPKTITKIQITSDHSKEDEVADSRISNELQNECQYDAAGMNRWSELAQRNLNETRLKQNHDRDSEQGNTSDGDFYSKAGLQPQILLVEDNKINVMVARSMLKQLGHTIDVVNNGLEAILAFQHSHYDLILMDVCMPVMDGLQATRLIRSYEEQGFWDPSVANCLNQATLASRIMPESFSKRLPDSKRFCKRTPIIAMTANALSESAEDCISSGMDSYISKPVNFEKLKQCLSQYLPC